MQDGLFFRVLRRFNILWVALLGILLIVAFGYHAWKSPFFRHELLGGPVPPTVSISPLEPRVAQEAVEPEGFGSPSGYYGPDENTVMVLNHYNAYPAATADYTNFEPKQALNLMVLDQKTGEGHWLFSGHKQIIVVRDVVYEGVATAKSTANTDTRPVIGLVMCVIDSDTNKDGAITTKDAPSLYLWTKGMTAAKKLLAMDEMISIGQYDADRYIVVYKKGKDLRTVTYSIPDFKQLSDKRMPDAPK